MSDPVIERFERAKPGTFVQHTFPKPNIASGLAKLERNTRRNAKYRKPVTHSYGVTSSYEHTLAGRIAIPILSAIAIALWLAVIWTR
jgi:hypothetical protein